MTHEQQIGDFGQHAQITGGPRGLRVVLTDGRIVWEGSDPDLAIIIDAIWNAAVANGWFTSPMRRCALADRADALSDRMQELKNLWDEIKGDEL